MLKGPLAYLPVLLSYVFISIYSHQNALFLQYTFFLAFAPENPNSTLIYSINQQTNLHFLHRRGRSTCMQKNKRSNYTFLQSTSALLTGQKNASSFHIPTFLIIFFFLLMFIFNMALFPAYIPPP